MYKITFLQTDLSKGGAERRIAVLANGLAKMGVDVEIALFESGEVAYPLDDRVKIVLIDSLHYPYKSSLDRIVHRIKDVGFNILLAFPLRVFAHIIRPIWKKPTLFYETKREDHKYEENIGRNIREYVRKNPDRTLISFTSATVLKTAPALSNIRHGCLIISESADPSWNTNTSFDQKRNYYYNQADVCVFQTPGAMEYFPQSIQDKGVVIPNPVTDCLPESWKKERQKAVVNYCRLDPVKNLELLIDAFALFRKKHSDYELYIYGDEPDYLTHLNYKESLHQRIVKLNLDECVNILPFRKDIHDVVRSYAMYVSSSDHEGLSNAMLEAMAIGLPVICTDCPSGGAAFAIENYQNGILVPVKDAERMAEAMCYLVENPVGAAQMAERATAIKDRLSQEAICERWLELIKEKSTYHETDPSKC